LRVADEYVWVYGEKFRWWPAKNSGVKEQSWAEALPGIEAALGFARDPIPYARDQMARLRAAGKLTDLIRNGDFSTAAGTRPAEWGDWQEETTSNGTFAWDKDVGATAKGAARAGQVASGCFTQATPVKPGERYAVQAARQLQGKGEATIRVRWQTADGKWTLPDRDRIFSCAAPRGQWSEIFGAVTVPEDVGKLVVLLGVHGQHAAEDVAWYDDVHLYKLE
jgi:hypothetical protein